MYVYCISVVANEATQLARKRKQQTKQAEPNGDDGGGGGLRLITERAQMPQPVHRVEYNRRAPCTYTYKPLSVPDNIDAIQLTVIIIINQSNRLDASCMCEL